MADDISKWKVADLKRELKARGQIVTGNKSELLERLLLSLRGENSLITEPDSAAGDPEEILDEDDVLADEEEEEEALVDEMTSPELKRKLSEEEEEEEEETPSVANKRSAAKKIVLNRNVVAVSVPSSGKENQQVVGDSDTGQKPDTPTTDKKVVKLSAYSVKERLELRALKFGVKLSTDAKKEARAARFGLSAPTPASAEVLRKRAERFGLTASPISTINVNKAELNEKLEKRKQRFGIEDKSVDEKKQQRAERFKLTNK